MTGKRVIQAHHLLFLPQGTTLFLDWHFFLFVIPVVLIIQQFRALLRGRYFDQGLWGIIGSIYFAIGYSLISAIALLLPWALP